MADYRTILVERRDAVTLITLIARSPTALRDTSAAVSTGNSESSSADES